MLVDFLILVGTDVGVGGCGVCVLLVVGFAVAIVVGFVGVWVLDSLGLACGPGFLGLVTFLGWGSFGEFVGFRFDFWVFVTLFWVWGLISGVGACFGEWLVYCGEFGVGFGLIVWIGVIYVRRFCGWVDCGLDFNF